MEALDLTVIIIVHNEAENLRQLLPELGWARAVVVVCNHCDDESAAVARAQGATVLTCDAQDFANVRNCPLAQVATKWLFYLDADERVTPALRREISHYVQGSETEVTALRLRRENYHYGYPMAHGGWEKDEVTRIFRTDSFQGWTGAIHESPQFVGQQVTLTAPLLHFTHRNTAENLAKSSRWTIKEAELLVAGGTPPVRAGTIVRKVLMEFYRRYWRDQGWRDGMAGFVESFTQACNRGFVYVQVWELQQQPSLPERYAALEAKVKK